MIGLIAGVLLVMTFSVALAFVAYKLIRKFLRKHAKKWFKFSNEQTSMDI